MEGDSETLLSHADLALYQAKEKGKNRWVSYEPVLRESLERSSRVRADLRAACETPGAFILHYQPQVDLRTGKILGFEALLRWNHPVKGVLLPEEFIGIAQTDAPLIARLGERVLEESLSQLDEWGARGWSYPVSVNIGDLHFLSPGFMKAWNALWLRFPEVPRNRLRIEITESAALRDMARSRALIEALRGEGSKVFLDSFGSGSSSLTLLQDLSVSGIRTDLSLARTLLSGSSSVAVVSGMTIMARMLKIDLLLKGVENFEQGILFMAMGGRLVQGYAIGHPQPAAAIPIWIQSFALPEDWHFWADLSWSLPEIGLLREALDLKRRIREWADNPLESPECLHEKEGNRCFWELFIAGEGRERFGNRPEFQEIVEISGRLHKTLAHLSAMRPEKWASPGIQELLSDHREMIRLLGSLVS